ncbi:hypothetical protein FISHEDRAFT_67963 [Fistulina hepatica ATCC 64428]|nr:hypothetical protein FISHEDRAFT_67963 [Fistulina hepatica ATCC 64428]
MNTTIVDVHTPTSSFAFVHSFAQESLDSIYDQLTRKVQSLYPGDRVGPGWLRYEFNEIFWNLDDDADYTIFSWRLQQSPDGPESSTSSAMSSSPSIRPTPAAPILHLHNPALPLPQPPDYQNPLFYAFRPSRVAHNATPSPRPRSMRSRKTAGSRLGSVGTYSDDGVPQHKKEFERFHSENGVRTVMGSFGPVQNVRMLLKSGYRHVYISRKFALKHNFLPDDAAPGSYGYGGLVNIGMWPITLYPSGSPPAHGTVDKLTPSVFNAKKGHKANGVVAATPSSPGTVQVPVYLSEEQHFDVVLGRSFFEKRQVRTSAVDLTDVVCLDTGEKIECELVILKDGRGEIVTVT